MEYVREVVSGNSGNNVITESDVAPVVRVNIYIPDDADIGSCDTIIEDYLKNNSDNQSNFDILMTVMGNSEAELQYAKNCGIMLFTIMFPDYQIKFLPNRILFINQRQVILKEGIGLFNEPTIKGIIS